MEENKKLDQLFGEARKTQPMVSFNEAKVAFEQKLAANQPIAINSPKSKMPWIIACAAVVVAATGFYFLSFDTPVEQSSPVAIESTTIQSPVGQPAEKAEVVTENAQPVADNSAKENIAEPAEAASAPKLKDLAAKEKTTTEMIHSANVTASAKVGKRNNYSYSDNRGKFALEFVDGELENLSLDNAVVEKSKWNAYKDVIEKGKNKVSGSAITSTNTSTDFMNVMINRMVEEGLVDESTKTVSLTKDYLKINDAEKDKATHKKYLGLYKQTTGEDIGNNTVSFKH